MPSSEQLALVSIASRGGQHSWWHPYADTLSDAYLDYAIMESAASEIMIYEAQLIPDLLQTDEYARAIAAAEPGYVTDQQREDAVAAKAARRQAMLSEGRRISVVLGEGALHQVVGGADVLAGQIGHLARLSDDAPAITFQVLPFSAGAHACAGSVPAILRFPDAPSLCVVYLEALSGGVYLESQADVARYIRAFALLRAAPSARLIAHACCGASRPRAPARRRTCGPGGAADGSRRRACR